MTRKPKHSIPQQEQSFCSPFAPHEGGHDVPVHPCVDRAALDVALELGIPCGGWCPKGRRSEDGVIPDKYPLQETTIGDYRQRTEWNVRDSDGTLILSIGQPSGGTVLTVQFAEKHLKPCQVIDLAASSDPSTVGEWIKKNSIKTLNVAGPRGSKQPQAYKLAVELLRQMVETLSDMS